MQTSSLGNLRERRLARPILVVLAGLILGCVVLTATARAASLVGEQFVYPPGTPLPGMNLGWGWAAPWVGSNQMVSAPPTLAYPLALPSGGITLENPMAGEGWRDFGPVLDNTANDLWISFQQRTLVAGGGAFVSIDPAGAFPTVMVAKDGGGAVMLGGVGPPVFAGLAGPTGQVDFFVLRLRRFAGLTKVDLYLNPTGPFGPPSASFGVASPFFIARFYYRSDPQQQLDEIRIGTSPTDVAAMSVLGDMNCDGVINNQDIDAFVLALFNPGAYATQFPNCNILNGDFTGDGVLNNQDIDGFVAALFGQ